MEQLNYSLFLLMNASYDGSNITIARLAAEWPIWITAAIIAVAAFRTPKQHWPQLLCPVTAVGLTLCLAYLIRHIWYHPRPFVIDIGHTYLAHEANASFPSNHSSLLFAIAFGLLLTRGMRVYGLIILTLACIVGWARVYVGVHFPLDILGAILLALVINLVCRSFFQRCIVPRAWWHRFSGRFQPR